MALAIALVLAGCATKRADFGSVESVRMSQCLAEWQGDVLGCER